MKIPARATFRFYGELNDHLAPRQRYKPLEKTFFAPSTVKDMIESFGIPHGEVDLIVAGGESVGFAYLVKNEDRIAVYPVFESFDITPALRVRPHVLRDPRFVLDVHLGKLAAYLRMLGFDTEYKNGFTDTELVRISSAGKRILLTRDRALLKHGALTHAYWLRQTDSRKQVTEVLGRFDLARSLRPFTRCLRCNAVLEPVAKEKIRNRLPPPVAELSQDFLQCPACGRVYWKGTHYARMRRWIDRLAQSTSA